MDPLDEQHGGDDRARAGQQRGTQRDERQISPKNFTARTISAPVLCGERPGHGRS
jgi:hypothetical protein